MADAVPDQVHAAVSPPDPRLSRLRCFFFFECEDPTAGFYYAQGHTWWITNLRELCYDMNKEYSRTASRLAIPQLMNEINILRDPQRAEERFEFMALDPGLSWAPIETAEEDNEELLA